VVIDNNEDKDHMQEAMLDVQINFPALNVTMVPLEIQEDKLMNDEGMQNQDDQNNEEMPNILVGRVQLVERHVPELFRDMPPKAFSDPSGLWGKYFALDKGMTPICMRKKGQTQC
jgi:short-subunit dehydrogenase involved in D-alanine esterification of teichoic acids